MDPFVDHESQARSHLLQLVIDAGSVPLERRPVGLEEHIDRLWRAIANLLWTTSPTQHVRLVPDPAADNRRRTAERFLALVDAGDAPATPAPRMIPVDRLRDAIAVVDRFLVSSSVCNGGLADTRLEARRGLELVRGELVALVTP